MLWEKKDHNHDALRMSIVHSDLFFKKGGGDHKGS